MSNTEDLTSARFRRLASHDDTVATSPASPTEAPARPRRALIVDDEPAASPSKRTTTHRFVDDPPEPIFPPWAKWVAIAAAIVLVVLVAVRLISGPGHKDAIQQTATRYFAALAKADAQAARDELADPPASDLLTNQVLQASQRQAALTDPHVSTVELSFTGTRGTATVNYTLGQEPATTQLPMVYVGGAWKIADGTIELTVPAGAVTVNGVGVTSTTQQVFPGRYTLTSTSDLITVTNAPAVTVTDVTSTTQLSGTLALTDKGRAAVTEAGKKLLMTCVTSTSSGSDGVCPWIIQDSSGKVNVASIKYRITNDPWANFNPTVDSTTGTITGRIELRVEASAEAKDHPGFRSVIPIAQSVDITVSLTESPLKARWGRP